jgi:hypothetical protein
MVGSLPLLDPLAERRQQILGGAVSRLRGADASLIAALKPASWATHATLVAFTGRGAAGPAPKDGVLTGDCGSAGVTATLPPTGMIAAAVGQGAAVRRSR